MISFPARIFTMENFLILAMSFRMRTSILDILYMTICGVCAYTASSVAVPEDMMAA